MRREGQTGQASQPVVEMSCDATVQAWEGIGFHLHECLRTKANKWDAMRGLRFHCQLQG
jgi:hypothetical protein